MSAGSPKKAGKSWNKKSWKCCVPARRNELEKLEKAGKGSPARKKLEHLTKKNWIMALFSKKTTYFGVKTPVFKQKWSRMHTNYAILLKNSCKIWPPGTKSWVIGTKKLENAPKKLENAPKSCNLSLRNRKRRPGRLLNILTNNAARPLLKILTSHRQKNSPRNLRELVT